MGSPTSTPVISSQGISLQATTAPEAGDPETGSEEEEDEGDREMEIDEKSDGEDDRRAHELLQAAPAQVGSMTPTSLPYSNHDFVVCFVLYKVVIIGSHTLQELSPDQSVLQQHYTRNRTPKAPTSVSARFSSVSISPSTPSKPPSDGRATLDAYPPLWRGVINNAKKTFRVYLAGKNGFPNPAEAVKEAQECLEDALAVFREEGGAVEPSEHHCCD